MNSKRLEEDLESLRNGILMFQDEIKTLVKDSCPGDHKAVQHRDGRSKWCNACRRYEDGRHIFTVEALTSKFINKRKSK